MVVCNSIVHVIYFCFTTGVSDYLCSVDLQNSDQLQCYSSTPVLVCESFCELADALVSQYNLPPPTTFDNSIQLYFNLIFLMKVLI